MGWSLYKEWYFHDVIRRTLSSSVLLRVLVAGAIGLGLGACATFEQELQRADDHFAKDAHESTLATLRELEPDWPGFGTKDRARYAYIRGMTDYRVGFKADARHWLAVAGEIERQKPGCLDEAQKKLLEDKLAEMNAIVWAGDVLPVEEPAGTSPLKKVTTSGDDDSPKAKKKPSTDDVEEDSPKAKKKPAKDEVEDESPKPKKKPKKDE